MTKPREKTREELQAEIEDGKKKIRQLENREKMLLASSDKRPASASDTLSDDALMDTVQRRTFQYFWEGGEPYSGMARER